jgi:hypothetical protein
LAFESGENELVQQEIAMANSFEPLEVEVYLWSSLKKLAVGLRFKFQTMSGAEPDNVQLSQIMSCWTGHCLVRVFCEVCLNFGVARVRPDNVRLEVYVCG